MALTNDQYLMHVGACLQKYLQEELATDGVIDERGIKIAAKKYVLNGAQGTQAERKEAMQTLLRRVYKKVTGKDYVPGDHHYHCHWLREQVDISEVEA